MGTRTHRSKWQNPGIVAPESLWQCKPKTSNGTPFHPAPKGSVSEWTVSQYCNQSIKAMCIYSRLSGKSEPTSYCLSKQKLGLMVGGTRRTTGSKSMDLTYK